MATLKRIQSALISVYHKDGLDPIVQALHQYGVTIYSTGGTQAYLEAQGIPVQAVEDLTTYPSILDGRVKTLHPKVFGGILARREPAHTAQLEQYDIPEIDLVIVDLYPFEKTVASTEDEATIIEKIDIGGISLIRAAAKNFQDVVIVPSMADYDFFQQILEEKQGFTDLSDRKELARRAFKVSSHYDTAIYSWFNKEANDPALKISIAEHQVLRYGENPHQQGFFHGNLEELLGKLGGKELSFNNLVDVDAALALMYDLKDQDPSFVVIKHTNACGVATRPTVLDAWKAALAADPVSAFGGILISNATIDLVTAQAIDELFYEVLLAPDFTPDALELLLKKKNRIVLQIKKWAQPGRLFKRLLNGVVEQDNDLSVQTLADLRWATQLQASPSETEDLLFANICVKHLKSNAIALVKNRQLIAMGCGQTSRIDALKAAIAKARAFGFDPAGAVMASDAFFPFPDCVEIAHEAGINVVIQPGGSVKDQDSIDYCNAHGMAMAMTGTRHFRH